LWKDVILKNEGCSGIFWRNVVITGYYVDCKALRDDTFRVLFKHIGSQGLSQKLITLKNSI